MTCADKIGGKTKAKMYLLGKLPKDKKGYIKLPLKAVITPAYCMLSPTARALYLILLSQHIAVRAKEKEMAAENEDYTEEIFPTFEIAYSQLVGYGFSKGAVSAAIKELEDYKLIIVDHGEWNADPEQGKSNRYQLTSRFLHLY